MPSGWLRAHVANPSSDCRQNVRFGSVGGMGWTALMSTDRDAAPTADPGSSTRATGWLRLTSPGKVGVGSSVSG